MTAQHRALSEMLRDKQQIEEVTAAQQLFDEEPVTLDVFVQDKKFLGNPPLFPKQYEAIREMERIFFAETYVTLVAELGPYWMPPKTIKNFLYLEFGKGSGKDHLCRIGAARVAYLLSCLKEPQLYYSLAPQDDIHTLNVATTAPQARRAFFKPLGTLIQRSPWFKKHLRSDITDLSTSIRLEKQLEMVSGHSLAESFEGLNLILAVADEIAAFRAARELMTRGKELRESSRTAEAIMKVLRSSARSRFPQTFKLCAISYPRYQGDPIEALVATGKKDIAAKGEDSRYYVSGPLATWEVNPKITGPEDFQEDFDEDPYRALATYACKPQKSPNRFFRNTPLVDQTFPPLAAGALPPLEVEYYWGPNDSEDTLPGQVPAWGWQTRFVVNEALWPKTGALYAVHADLAVSGDRAGIAMSHVRTWLKQDSPDKAADDRPVVRTDFVTAFESDMTAENPDTGELAQREIQLRWFRRLVRFLIERGFAIQYVTLDGWQSVETVQQLNAWGIEAAIQSMDRTTVPYTTLRDMIYDGRLESYDDGVVKDEIEALTLLNNGKIDHPADGSKDEADALCGSVLGALHLGGDEGDVPEKAVFGTVFDLSIAAGTVEAADMSWHGSETLSMPFGRSYL